MIDRAVCSDIPTMVLLHVFVGAPAPPELLLKGSECPLTVWSQLKGFKKKKSVIRESQHAFGGHAFPTWTGQTQPETGAWLKCGEAATLWTGATNCRRNR